MPLAGRMKLRTFLVLAGAGTAVLLTGIGIASWYGFMDYQARWMERYQAEQQRMEEKAERDRVAREAARVERARVEAERARAEEERREALIAQGIDPDAAPPAPDPPPAVDLPTGRPVDDVVSRYLGKPLGTSKRKDVTQGQRYKVNVYQDGGFDHANRAKIDLDRDDRWDEKWTWDQGTISRKIAPADDEVYTVEEVWQGGAWVAR